MGIINFAKPITGNVFADIILWLVNITSVVGGVILFTLLLKLVTFPFDYASRASMRKNSVRMEEMRPELEKLQKQYADNKNLYNQKMMALYKKNGYSMFGACLPTILTLVIFIIAINGFTAYSQFQNKQYFYDMSVSYNNVVYSGLDIDNNYIVRTDDGIIEIKDKELYDLADVNGGAVTIAVDKDQDGNKDFDIFVTKTNASIFVETTNSFVKYQRDYSTTTSGEQTTVNFTNLKYLATSIKNDILLSEENNNLKIKRVIDGVEKEISFADASQTLYDEKVELAYAKYKAETAGELKDKETFTNEYKVANPIANYISGEYLSDFINDIQKQKSAETFRNGQASFLWVKNIWVTDSPMSHPVESNWDTFKATHAYGGHDIGNDDYQKLIYKLDAEKTAPNGFFILVIMTAGISLLMQIVTTKSQKAQMELQTVDGQGMQTQKLMKWIMPIMMAVFSFMYTAAFAIYIVISSGISILTTYLINFIVDRKLKKQSSKKSEEEKVIRGRVYTPKEEVKEEKKGKKAQENVGDFLAGDAQPKTHVRGRLK